MKTLARRLARLEETRKAGRTRRFSALVEVCVFETREDAVARHRATYGDPPRGQGRFIVPAKPRNTDEEAECARRFMDQQLRLAETAKRARVAATSAINEPAMLFPVGKQPAVPFPPAYPPKWVMN